ncbi:hypothetical protein B0H16DRAFT_1256854, partial [Mycena metata]
KAMLLEGGLGAEWEGLVDTWWALEASTKFVSGTKAHPTTSRPAEVGIWVKNARKGTPQVNVETFSKQWWEWWQAINPKGRVVEGQLAQIEGGEQGGWEGLRRPGQNGFLNVVVCLRWWRVAAGKETDNWKRAVGDVKWVLGRM